MSDTRQPLGSLPRTEFGGVKVTTADIDTDGLGTAANADGSVTDAKLATAARGRIKYTGASGWSNLDAKGSGKILVGDGTDINSVPVSGDVTLSTAGAVTVAPGAIGTLKLDANIQARRVSYPVPTIPTTGATEVNILAPLAATIAGVRFTPKDALAANNTNYVTFTLTNRTTGAGTTVVLNATAANTTQATGGSALVAYTSFAMSINSSNNTVAANDCLSFAVTATGTLANTVTEGCLSIVFSPTS